MPNIKSAKKRLRQDRLRRLGNQSVKSNVKTRRRKFFESLDAENVEEGRKAYADYCASLDRAVKRGVIKKNTASRRKSRAAARLRVTA